jgi:hypothetical protein
VGRIGRTHVDHLTVDDLVAAPRHDQPLVDRRELAFAGRTFGHAHPYPAAGWVA